jgi:hypothetical protein
LTIVKPPATFKSVKARKLNKREEYIYYTCSNVNGLLRKKGLTIETHYQSWHPVLTLCKDCAPVSKEEAKEKFPELF